MKRLHLLSASYCISLGEEIGTKELEHQLAFLKYVWEHKDDDLTIIGMGIKTHEPTKVPLKRI